MIEGAQIDFQYPCETSLSIVQKYMAILTQNVAQKILQKTRESIFKFWLIINDLVTQI